VKTIRISQAVWDAMVKVGKFGETPDDVLRRVFGISEQANSSTDKDVPRPLRRLSQSRMTTKVYEGQLLVKFEDGKSKEWPLPDKSMKLEIKNVRDQAIEFATSNGATVGQLNAIRKALTEAGYHLTK